MGRYEQAKRITAAGPLAGPPPLPHPRAMLPLVTLKGKDNGKAH